MLWIAATPIGNLADASPRLRDALASADVIAAEDTRRTRQLLRLLEIDSRADMVAVHDHNEHELAESLVQRAMEQNVVLVSDAGTPTISDPGFRVVQLAGERAVPMSVLPGPSAPLAALAISGLPTDRFVFEGFLPKKAGERAARIDDLSREPRTLVLFEAPGRLGRTLDQLATAFGADRPAAICRELTKLHEETRRGGLAELAEWAQQGVRGEIVIVVGGAKSSRVPQQVALREVRALVAAGERLKDAAKSIAEHSGWSSRELYALILEASDTSTGPVSR